MSNHKKYSLGRSIMTMFVFLNAIVLSEAFTSNGNLYWMLALTIPILVLAIFNVRQKRPFIAE